MTTAPRRQALCFMIGAGHHFYVETNTQTLEGSRFRFQASMNEKIRTKILKDNDFSIAIEGYMFEEHQVPIF
jgi:hypothetical protein